MTTSEAGAARLYAAYGLSVESDVELVGLPGADRVADVQIRYGTVPEEPTAEVLASGGCYNASPREAFLFYHGIGRFAIREGREITVEPLPQAEQNLIRHVLLGVAFGILLHQRGLLTLHASAVNLGGEAVALVGWKRMGKSTTAAALHAAGHELITDDTLVLDRERPGLVLPGVRQLKLDPQAVTAAIGKDPKELPALQEGYGRRVHALRTEVEQAPLPLARIYSQEWGEELRIEPLPMAAAFVELLRHSYAQRFLGAVSGTPEHFRQVDRLVRCVPVFRLVKPVALDRLPEIVSAIEEHAATSVTV